MSKRNFIVRGGRAVQTTRDEATAALDDADLVWIHFDDCEDATQAWLSTCQRLTPVVVDALIAAETRPRMQPIGDGALVNLRGLDHDRGAGTDLLSSIRMWVDRGQVFSVSRRELSVLEPVAEQVLRGKILDPGDLVAALAVAITEELDPEVAGLGDTIDQCEELFGQDNPLAMRQTIAKSRAQAIIYRRFVAPQRTALDRLAELEAKWLSDEDRLHLKDAADRAARMAEELESIRERSALLHEQLTDLRAETIETRSLVLSVAALVFLPLTVLTGLLGMNVEGIPFADEPWAFAAVCVLCIVIAAGVAFYFIRRHWLR